MSTISCEFYIMKLSVLLTKIASEEGTRSVIIWQKSGLSCYYYIGLYRWVPLKPYSS